MTALAWKLNRIRCMSPAEVLYRVGQAAAAHAERLGLARCEVPEADLSAEVRPWIHLDRSIDARPYAAAADRYAAGIFDLFALRGVELGTPPNWNRDPLTGIEAPLTFGKQLDYRDERRVGDCKYLWEPNRHLHIVTFAQAWALTRDARHAEALRSHLSSWFEACPFRMGANWSSSLEAGIRLANWALAWQLIGGAASPLFSGAAGRAFRKRWMESVYQHAEFVNGHYSLHSSANNHLIGEAAGVYLASMAWPCWARADAWHDAARAILEREALLQIAPDGVNREQSTAYALWTFELLLLPYLAGRANGDDFPVEYARRLEATLGFLASVMDVGGNVPMIGDADDGCVARLDPRGDAGRFRSAIALGAVLFDRPDFEAKAGTPDERARWLLGDRGDRGDAQLAPRAHEPLRREFPDGGYCVMGAALDTPDEIRLVADAGALGYREIAAHGHADALAFTLSVGGVEMLVDPGTYAYHRQPEWRQYFRGTSAHNTLRVDGRDQSEQGGNFMWLRKAKAHRTLWRSTDAIDLFEGWHDGYEHLEDPVRHARRITVDKGARRIAIEDMLDMEGTHEVELFFHCAEDSSVREEGGAFVLARAGRSIALTLPAGGSARLLVASREPAAGWVSRGFDRKEAAPTIAWRATLTGATRLATAIECRP